MTSITQPLRDEHRELWPRIEAMAATADALGEAPVPAVRAAVGAAHDFLTNHLMPHAEAEERVLYPTVETLLRTPDATATMSRDHVEVGRLTAELGQLREKIAGASADAPLDADVLRDLRRVLYGLSAVVRLHFAKEEEVYLPLLDARLGQADAAGMFDAMGAAAAAAAGRAA